MSHGVKSFATSYYKNEFLKIDATLRDVLIIQGRNGFKNGYLWVRTYNDQNVPAKEYVVAIRSDGSLYSQEHLSLRAGVYRISFLIGAQRYGSYSGFLPDIPYVIENMEASILLPEVFHKNLKCYQAKEQDIGDKHLKEGYGVKSRDRHIIELAKSITAGLSNDYEKVKAVHDWVAQNIAYDTTAFFNGSYTASNQDAISVLAGRKAVCQGYSNLTASLLRAVNIRERIVSGICLGYGMEQDWNQVDQSKVNHVWNEAYADGRWIITDVTWDSGYIGADKAFHPRFMHGYFDVTLEMLSFDHMILDSQD